MKRYSLSTSAADDIERILEWTELHFGKPAALRYQTLIIQAIRDVAFDSQRSGCVPRPDLRNGVCTYHLRFSRAQVKPARLRVKDPRHFLILRAKADGTIEISRVLHDSADLARHLPPLS